MSEPLDLEELANIRERLNRPTTLQKTVFRIIAEADIAKLLAEVDRLRAALHGSEAGPRPKMQTPTCGDHGPMALIFAQHRCALCGTVDEVAEAGPFTVASRRD